MTYLGLLLLGLLPPIGLLACRGRHRNIAPSVPNRQQATALALLTVLAVLAAVPWDAALIAHGTWSYPHHHLLGRVAGVPVEEILFMILQPVLVGLWLRGLPPHLLLPAPTAPRCHSRIAGTAGWLVAAAAGAAMTVTPRGSYAGWLLVWAAPLLALQRAAGGDVLRQRRALLTVGTAVPVLYLCALDRVALHLQLWELSPAHTSGLALLGLPLEEALFFTLTSLLVTSGLLLATDRTVLVRVQPRSARRERPDRLRSRPFRDDGYRPTSRSAIGSTSAAHQQPGHPYQPQLTRPASPTRVEKEPRVLPSVLRPATDLPGFRRDDLGGRDPAIGLHRRAR